MSEHTPIYSKSRFSMQIAKGTCRGCHRPITMPRRKTWCSQECKQRYDPYRVKRAVMARDKHICQMCGLDIRAAWRDWNMLRPRCQDTPQKWHEWRAARPKEEYDHIVPFSEGGATVVENMRTLCGECHKKRTAEWRKSKAVKS